MLMPEGSVSMYLSATGFWWRGFSFVCNRSQERCPRDEGRHQACWLAEAVGAGYEKYYLCCPLTMLGNVADLLGGGRVSV